MVDALACIAVEEQEIAALQIVDGIDPFPAVVFRVGVRTAAAHRYARLFQTVIDETGAVERIGSFITQNVRIAELILCAADHAVGIVRITGIFSG